MPFAYPHLPLFVPAHREPLRRKALAMRHDCFVLDLEDAVPETHKTEARLGAAAFIAERPHAAIVRINAGPRLGDGGQSSSDSDDLIAVVQPSLRAILAPKVESARDVVRLDAALAILERLRGIPAGEIPVLALIETARGVAAVDTIAAASIGRRLCLCFGAGDFTLDLGVAWTGEEAECGFARGRIVVASRAHDLPAPIDSAMPEINDAGAVLANAGRAAAAGFGTKFAIHPAQIAPMKQAFGPTADQIAWAGRVIDADAAHRQEGHGAFRVDGQMVDEPIVARARALLLRAMANEDSVTEVAAGE